MDTSDSNSSMMDQENIEEIHAAQGAGRVQKLASVFGEVQPRYTPTKPLDQAQTNQFSVYPPQAGALMYGANDYMAGNLAYEPLSMISEHLSIAAKQMQQERLSNSSRLASAAKNAEAAKEMADRLLKSTQKDRAQFAVRLGRAEDKIDAVSGHVQNLSTQFDSFKTETGQKIADLQAQNQQLTQQQQSATQQTEKLRQELSRCNDQQAVKWQQQMEHQTTQNNAHLMQHLAQQSAQRDQFWNQQLALQKQDLTQQLAGQQAQLSKQAGDLTILKESCVVSLKHHQAAGRPISVDMISRTRGGANGLYE